MASTKAARPPTSGTPAPSAPGVPSAGPAKPLESSISVERAFRVDGQRVTVQVTLPASLAREIGMDSMLTIAQKLLVTVESSEAKITPLRMGQG